MTMDVEAEVVVEGEGGAVEEHSGVEGAAAAEEEEAAFPCISKCCR